MGVNLLGPMKMAHTCYIGKKKYANAGHVGRCDAQLTAEARAFAPLLKSQVAGIDACALITLAASAAMRFGRLALNLLVR
jgi:hypothetical protein